MINNRAGIKTLSSPYAVYVIAIAAFTIGMMPLYVKTGGFFPHSDATVQILPFIAETKRMLMSGAPLWSWNTYLGDNFVGSYAYYTLTSPIAWLCCLFPYKWLGIGFTLTLYLKILACIYISRLYFRALGFDRTLCDVGAMLYAFSSWAITNLTFYVFMEPMIVFPWLLYAIERYIGGSNRYGSLLAAAVAVTTVVNYYFAVGSLIVAALYFLCRVIYLDTDSRRKLALTLGCVVQVALGLLAACVVIVPVAMHLSGSSRMGSAFWMPRLSNFAERFIMMFLPEMHEGVSGLLYLPNTYYSTSTSIAVYGALPVIGIYCIKGHRWLKVLIALLLVIYLTPLTAIMTLMVFPAYTRWAYALTLMIILALLYVINDRGSFLRPLTKGYIVGVTVLYLCMSVPAIVWMHINGYSWGDAQWSNIMLGIALAFSLVSLYICNSRGFRPRLVLGCTGLCAAVECLGFAMSFADTVPFAEPNHYITESDVVTSVEIASTSAVYTSRTDYREVARNMSMIMNTPSTGTYHSVQNPAYSTLFAHYGQQGSVEFVPSKHCDSFDALMSVSRIAELVPGETPRLSFRETDVYVPFGFAYDRYCLRDDMEHLVGTDADITLGMLGSMVIRKDDEVELSRYMTKSDLDTHARLDSVAAERRRLVCTDFEATSRGFTAKADFGSPQAVFFSVPADKGFRAYIDGIETKIYDVNLGMMAVAVPPGPCTIRFEYMPPGLIAGSWLTLLGIITICIEAIITRKACAVKS